MIWCWNSIFTLEIVDDNLVRYYTANSIKCNLSSIVPNILPNTYDIDVISRSPLYWPHYTNGISQRWWFACVLCLCILSVSFIGTVLCDTWPFTYIACLSTKHTHVANWYFYPTSLLSVSHLHHILCMIYIPIFSLFTWNICVDERKIIYLVDVYSFMNYIQHTTSVYHEKGKLLVFWELPWFY